jgi:spore coat protein U-like protein
MRAARSVRAEPRSVVRALSLALLFAAPPILACSVDTTPLAFGAIDPLLRAPSDSVASLTVRCDEEQAYSIAIAGSGQPLRVMQSGSNTLAYQIYLDASRQSIWGDGSHGSISAQGSASAAGTTHHLYGRVPSQPQAVPGLYVDTLLISISF